jgi:hypothetical protein
VQLQTTGQPCGQQSIVDGAFETAKHLTQLALIRVGRVKAIGISPGIAQEGEEIPRYRSAVVDTFGDASITALERIERELGAIQAKLGSRPNQLCAAASAVGCARDFVAYVDKAVADTIFYCPAFFDPVQSPNERALKTIHEVAHVLGKQHGGFDHDDEGMVHPCGYGLNIRFDEALDNAYAYETLIGCLTSTRAQVRGSEELTKKEMREQKRAERQP